MRYLYTIIMLLVVGNTYAQTARFSFMLSPIVIAHTGRSYGISLQYNVSEKFRLYLGFKYHQNLLVDPVLNSQKFRYRFYGDNAAQNLGYNVGVNYFLDWKHSALKPYLYCDVTYFNMNTRALIFTDVDSSVNSPGMKLKKVTPVIYYNLHSLESNIGLGLEYPFTKWLSINTKGGVGVNMIRNLPRAEYVSGRHTELSLQYVLGVQINL